MLHIYDGHVYIIKIDHKEPYDIYYERVKKILSHRVPSTDEEYNDLINMSRLWRNHKFYGCEYDSAKMNSINNFDSRVS